MLCLCNSTRCGTLMSWNTVNGVTRRGADETEPRLPLQYLGVKMFYNLALDAVMGRRSPSRNLLAIPEAAIFCQGTEGNRDI